MLEAARLGLVELGILDRSAPLPPFWARMSGNLVVSVYPDAGNSYLVKVGIRTSLDNEHQGLVTAYGAMPDHVPQPLGLTVARNFQLLVMHGLRHASLFPFRSARDERMFVDGIAAFFAVSAKAFRRDGPGRSQRELPNALSSASTLLDWPDCDRYRERAEPIVGALGRMLQHGDFAINNIARSGRRLVFFDWEDFGHIDVPGFDLAILMLSLHEFDVIALKRALTARSVTAAIMERGCASLGLTPSQFMFLFPAYLALFIRLKTALGYGPNVPRRAATALADWLRAPPAPPPAATAPGVETKKAARPVVRRSIAFAFAETYVMMVIQFVSSIVIARLLTPDEIGVFSVAVVAVSIAHTIREFGIVSYLIKEETLTDEKIRAASALSFATSWTLAVIIFASSFGLASFYRDPRLLHLLWVLALNFILIPFGSVVYAILRRRTRRRRHCADAPRVAWLRPPEPRAVVVGQPGLDGRAGAIRPTGRHASDAVVPWRDEHRKFLRVFANVEPRDRRREGGAQCRSGSSAEHDFGRALRARDGARRHVLRHDRKLGLVGKLAVLLAAEARGQKRR